MGELVDKLALGVTFFQGGEEVRGLESRLATTLRERDSLLCSHRGGVDGMQCCYTTPPSPPPRHTIVFC